MPKQIVLQTRHALGVEGAKQRITDRYEALTASKYMDLVGGAEMRWEGDTAHVSAKALGAKASAEIAVTDQDLTITIRLPFILTGFAGPIEAFLMSNQDALK